MRRTGHIREPLARLFRAALQPRSRSRRRQAAHRHRDRERPSQGSRARVAPVAPCARYRRAHRSEPNHGTRMVEDLARRYPPGSRAEDGRAAMPKSSTASSPRRLGTCNCQSSHRCTFRTPQAGRAFASNPTAHFTASSAPHSAAPRSSS